MSKQKKQDPQSCKGSEERNATDCKNSQNKTSDCKNSRNQDCR